MQYICTNCQHRFEAVPKEGLECPQCFWTSTVKELDEAAFLEEKRGQSKKSSRPQKTFPQLKFPSVNPVKILIFLIAVILIFGVVIYGRPVLEKAREKLTSLEQKNKTVASKKPAAKIQKPAKDAAPALESAPSDPLTPAERENLNRRILTTDLTFELSPADQDILKRRFSFKTGLIEKLPSALWNLEQYEELIAEQEKFYKVQLPRSYKKKLTHLFETSYLSSVKAFEEQDLLRARDFWVASLAFPVYDDNIQKHRGVVLTMLRPFIADTLSKIGAVNQILMDRIIRQREVELQTAYARLDTLLQEQNWKAAYQAAGELLQKTALLAKDGLQPVTPPNYPPATRYVDTDIQQTLADLTAAQRPAVMDTESLKLDLLAKKDILERVIPEKAESFLAFYHQAVESIQNEQWDKALELLKQVKAPAVLKKDADLKISLIEKIKRAGRQT